MPLKLEENFPRGGTAAKQINKHKSLDSGDLAKENDLFKDNENQAKSTKKRKLEDVPKSKPKKAKKQYFGIKDSSSPASISMHTQNTVSTGQLIYGCIDAIEDYKLSVSLPNGLHGSVNIAHISDSYTELLRHYAESESDEMIEEVSSLQDLFHVGHYIPCKVIGNQKKGTRNTFMLSIKPTEVNQSLQSTSLKQDMVLHGCVSSQEDHGYIIDIGIKGVNAFLKNKQAKKYIKTLPEAEQLHVGHHLDCVLSTSFKLLALTGDGRTFNVDADPAKISHTMISKDTTIPFYGIRPGMKVTATVEKHQASGVIVKIASSLTACLHKTHMLEDPHNYEKFKQIQCTVISVNPSSKLIQLTELQHIVTNTKPDFLGLSIGDILGSAVVTKHEKNAMYLNLPNGLPAFVHLHSIRDDPIQDLVKDFKKGSTHRCRIVKFDHFDNLVIVTLKKSILEQQFMSINDILPGSNVKCHVKSFDKAGMLVKITNQITGFVSKLHLADVPLTHPELKFKEDQKLKCRVLKVKTSSSKVELTHKITLIKSKLPVITSYDQLEPGMLLHGFVVKISDAGLLVVFYNNVKGWVPRNQLSDQRIEFPEKVFYLGQVVQCKVLNLSEDDNRLTLSLRISGKIPFGNKQIALPDDFAIGKLVDCQVKNKTEKGLEVLLQPSNMEAILPIMHLSDFKENCPLLFDIYKKNDVIKNAMYLKRTGIITLTKKASLIEAATDTSLIQDFDQIKPGLLCCGSVKLAKDYGVFVTFANDLSGLAPNKFICDYKFMEPQKVFDISQSVVAKVTEVDTEKRRFLLSLRMSDCYFGNTDIGINLLEQYLEQYEEIVKGLEPKRANPPALVSTKRLTRSYLSHLRIGDVVAVTVTQILEHGVTCSLKYDTQGLATNYHTKGVSLKEGIKCEALVLYVDVANNCVEVSLSHDLVKAVKHRQENKFTEVKEGQVIKSEVLLVKDSMVLVVLKGHASGKLAFVPAKKHLNDVLEKRQFVVGQVNPLLIKRVTEDRVLGSLKIHEDKNIEKLPKLIVSSHDFKIGQMLKVKVKSVLDLQLNIEVKGAVGRVFITEISDNVKQGENVLATFKKDQELVVWVIGFRDPTSHKPLSLRDDPSQKISLLECTMRSSKMNEEVKATEKLVKEKFKIGNQVTAFVSQVKDGQVLMQIGLNLRGYVSLVNISTEAEVLKDLHKHFQKGTAHKAVIVAVSRGFFALSLIDKKAIKIKPGAVVRGVISSVIPQQGLYVQLDEGHRGKVSLTDLADEYKDDQMEKFDQHDPVNCYVIGCDDMNKCILSLRPSRLGKKQFVKDPEIESRSCLKDGQIIRGFVNGVTETSVFVSLGRDIAGRVQAKKISKYFLKEISKAFSCGKWVTVKIIDFSERENKIELSMLEEDTGVKLGIPKECLAGKRPTEEVLKRKRKNSGSGSDIGQEKRSRRSSESDIENKDEMVKGHGSKCKLEETKKLLTDRDSNERVSEEQIPTKGQRKRKTSEMKEMMEKKNDEENDSDFEIKIVTRPLIKDSLPCLTLPSPNMTEDSPESESDSESDSQDDEDDSMTKPIAKKSKKELRQEKKREEEELIKKEEMLLSAEQEPQSADEFDRLVISSPDSSLVWLKYMAFLLEQSETEKARTVAERAIKTIDFREEQERLNVWGAYLNLENMCGTEDSMKKVLERAVQNNEPLKVYNQLITIYTASNKIEQAEKLYELMLKKYKQHKQVWIDFGEFCFNNSQVESARKLMHRSFNSLVKKDHVDIISKYAQMEFKQGEADRGRTMFENLLSTYSKRTDLWSVYIDMVIKQGDIINVRQLFERVTNMSFPVKKMKFFFKKYIDFESTHGDEDRVDLIKHKAIEFVESFTE